MKTLTIAGTAALLVSTAFADPMHSAKPPGHRPDTATPNPEALFVPIVPCRAFDGQQLNAGSARKFTLSGPTATCTAVPASATAVAISLTSTASSGNGGVSAYPYNMPSSTRALTFHSGSDETASVTVGLNANAIALKANGASTKIAGDITGYYAPQIEAFIFADGSIYSRTARVLSVTHVGTGSYNITVDRDVIDCAVQVTPEQYPNIAAGVGNGGDVINVYIFTGDGTKTPVDDYFNVSAHC